MTLSDVVSWWSLAPLACSPQIQPAEPEQPETGRSPRCSKACPPRYPCAAVDSTGGESVCAWKPVGKHDLDRKRVYYCKHMQRKQQCCTHKMKEMSSTKYFTRRKTKKEDICPFFQLSGATLEIFVSCSRKKNSSSAKKTTKNSLELKLQQPSGPRIPAAHRQGRPG